MRTSMLGWSAAAIAFGCSACGANVVDFGVDVGDGATNLASADATTDTRPMADAASPTDGRSPDSVSDVVGPPFGHHDAAAMCMACAPTMGTCMGSGDCCDGNYCYGNTCLPGGQFCSPPGSPCQPPVTCCSGRCEPTGPGGMPVCAGYCLPDNSPCTTATECCSLACNGGVCGGGGICGTIGSICQVNADCCAGDCMGGRCVVPPAASCLPSGEFCGDGGITCCSGICDPEMGNGGTGRCGVAGAYGEFGNSLPPGALCTRSAFSTCSENATCTYSVTAHVYTCQSQMACTPDGQRCMQPNDCCSRTCAYGVCGTSCTPF